MSSSFIFSVDESVLDSGHGCHFFESVAVEEPSLYLLSFLDETSEIERDCVLVQIMRENSFSRTQGLGRVQNDDWNLTFEITVDYRNLHDKPNLSTQPD